MDEAEYEIKVEELRAGFKRWSEKISTSPHRIHLRMYKSFMEMNEQKKEKGYVLKTVTGIINSDMTRGIMLGRWCLVHNVLLEKDTNNPTLHRLRIIHFIEANYNHATKIVWARRH